MYPPIVLQREKNESISSDGIWSTICAVFFTLLYVCPIESLDKKTPLILIYDEESLANYRLNQNSLRLAKVFSREIYGTFEVSDCESQDPCPRVYQKRHQKLYQ